MAGNAFGLTDTEDQSSADALAELEEDQTPAPETPAAPAVPEQLAPETPAAPATPEAPAADAAPAEPAAPETPATAVAEEPTTDTPAAATERMFAGRYKSVEDLEEGYQNLRALQTRTGTRVNDLERVIAQYEQVIQRVTPIIREREEQQRQQAAKPTIDEAQLRTLMEEDPAKAIAHIVQMLPAEVDRRVAAAREEIEQRVRGEVDRDRELRSAESAISDFRRTHPDIIAGSPEDEAIVEVVREFNLAWTQPGVLNDALEVSKNPNLRRVLRANPTFWDTIDGMDLARELSQIPRVRTATTQVDARQQAEQQRQAQAAARTAAHVERGGTGLPPQPPGGAPVNEEDEIISSWDKDQKSPLASPIFKG